MDADLVPIGEAARRLGVATSALRYYDERDIVRPAARTAGKRLYSVSELRSLGFVQMMQRLGVDLDTIAATLRDAGPPWSAVVAAHLAWLDDRITRAEEARRILRHARSCPHERPWRNCPYLIAVLDNWLREGAPPESQPAASDIADRWPDPWLARLTAEPDTDAELAARIQVNPQVALLFPWRGPAGKRGSPGPPRKSRRTATGCARTASNFTGISLPARSSAVSRTARG